MDSFQVSLVEGWQRKKIWKYQTLKVCGLTCLYSRSNRIVWIGEMFINYRSNLISGGKGEGAAGIFEAWDMNNDRKITVEEV